MAYSRHDRDLDYRDERMYDNVYGAPTRYSARDSVPSGRVVGIMLGAIVALVLLIALFSWVST